MLHPALPLTLAIAEIDPDEEPYRPKRRRAGGNRVGSEETAAGFSWMGDVLAFIWLLACKDRNLPFNASSNINEFSESASSRRGRLWRMPRDHRRCPRTRLPSINQ